MENKQVCCCHNVTVNDIKKQINEGVRDFETLQEKTKIGTDCPPCKEENAILFKKLLHELTEK